MMMWVKLVGGVVLLLLGLVWLGQGLGFIRGSFMTGQAMWAIIGAVLVVIAAWLLWSVVHSRRVGASSQNGGPLSFRGGAEESRGERRT
jgi:biotin transporter BioY